MLHMRLWPFKSARVRHPCMAGLCVRACVDRAQRFDLTMRPYRSRARTAPLTASVVVDFFSLTARSAAECVRRCIKIFKSDDFLAQNQDQNHHQTSSCTSSKTIAANNGVGWTEESVAQEATCWNRRENNHITASTHDT